MTIQYVKVHVTDGNDTLVSIVGDYRLSSTRAILEIPENRHLLEKLPRDGMLPEGLKLGIPPNAIQLVTERTYKLQQVRPLFLSHFNTLRQIVNADLSVALHGTDTPLEDKETLRLLGELKAFVDNEIPSIASHAGELVTIATAMSKTHVAEERDHLAARARQDPLCSLYWSLTPQVVQRWQSMWDLGLWQHRWRGLSGEPALRDTLQLLNTAETLVIHQLDARLREAFALKESLLAEQ